ncbi:DUF3784 domain-containing protein [Paenibacillus camelliae]|uniref:DUF3784 domain-containing protein n=1 Tax=Paenibacillus camelliae TaxID=512410 RepID=UPI00203F1F83|nr:DUF3784 domain-containing protein [Paenibacillus camelliae]MCM3634957.1 DUF3784 domain-containing protein [Paenibacillus camelliae]
MENNLWIVGLVFIVLGLIIGVGKQTWLLAGFNEKRVKNKTLLANLVGGYITVIGILFLISSFYTFLSEQILVGALVIGLFILIIFTNIKLVDKE